MRSVSEAIRCTDPKAVMVRMRFHELPCVHVSGIYRVIGSFCFFEKRMFTRTDFAGGFCVWWKVC